MRWACSIQWREKRAYRFCIGGSERKGKDNIKADLDEMGREDGDKGPRSVASNLSTRTLRGYVKTIYGGM
jgi:hypothetical protein